MYRGQSAVPGVPEFIWRLPKPCFMTHRPNMTNMQQDPQKGPSSDRDHLPKLHYPDPDGCLA